MQALSRQHPKSGSTTFRRTHTHTHTHTHTCDEGSHGFLGCGHANPLFGNAPEVSAIAVRFLPFGGNLAQVTLNWLFQLVVWGIESLLLVEGKWEAHP